MDARIESQRYLRTPEAARIVGLSPRTLEKHRVAGSGPVYRKVGGRVVYAEADLHAWVESGTMRHTAQARHVLTPAQALAARAAGQG